MPFGVQGGTLVFTPLQSLWVCVARGRAALAGRGCGLAGGRGAGRGVSGGGGREGGRGGRRRALTGKLWPSSGQRQDGGGQKLAITDLHQLTSLPGERERERWVNNEREIRNE